jgi:hypothetical protein
MARTLQAVVPASTLLSAMWTIGDSTRVLDELIALLRAHGIGRVTDVRRFPHSRRHPQFNTGAHNDGARLHMSPPCVFCRVVSWRRRQRR